MLIELNDSWIANYQYSQVIIWHYRPVHMRLTRVADRITRHECCGLSLLRLRCFVMSGVWCRRWWRAHCPLERPPECIAPAWHRSSTSISLIFHLRSVNVYKCFDWGVRCFYELMEYLRRKNFVKLGYFFRSCRIPRWYKLSLINLTASSTAHASLYWEHECQYPGISLKIRFFFFFFEDSIPAWNPANFLPSKCQVFLPSNSVHGYS
jgi:hypothetical protein